jgi:hypothetical protein
MCVNGLDYAPGDRFSREMPVAVRFDYRGPSIDLSLDRSYQAARRRPNEAMSFALKQSGFAEFLKQVIRSHLMSEAPTMGERMWEYKQGVAENFPLADFWSDEPDMLMGFTNSKPVHVSMSEAEHTQKVVLAMAVSGALRSDNAVRGGRFEELEIKRSGEATGLVIPFGFTLILADACRESLFARRQITEVTIAQDVILATWELSIDNIVSWWRGGGYNVWIAPWNTSEIIGFSQFNFPVGGGRGVLLNSAHPLVSWLIEARAACESTKDAASQKAFATLMDLFTEPIGVPTQDSLRRLQRFLENWKELSVATVTGMAPSIVASDFHFSTTKNVGRIAE